MLEALALELGELASHDAALLLRFLNYRRQPFRLVRAVCKHRPLYDMLMELTSVIVLERRLAIELRISDLLVRQRIESFAPLRIVDAYELAGVAAGVEALALQL